MKNLNNTAFTLLEVLLSAVIFVVTVAGLFATLNAIRQPVTTQENALSATIFGKQVLETLRSQVNASIGPGTFYGTCSTIVAGACTDFSLYLGLHNVTALPAGLIWPGNLAALNPNGLVYTVYCANTNSTTICNPDIARKVTLNITSS